MTDTDTDNALTREERIEQFGEEQVEHTEWWAAELERVREINEAIIEAIDDRDDVQLAKRHHSVEQSGEHEASFTIRIAGEPFRTDGEEVRVYRCGACEKVFDEPYDPKPGVETIPLACPHCGTEIDDEGTEVRDVEF